MIFWMKSEKFQIKKKDRQIHMSCTISDFMFIYLTESVLKEEKSWTIFLCFLICQLLSA